MTKAVLILLTLTLVFGCAVQPAVPPTTSTGNDGTITVTGTITDEGVECLAMRGDDGKLYTLGRPENPPAAGTRVRVTGTVAETSICMQGTTLVVSKLERL